MKPGNLKMCTCVPSISILIIFAISWFDNIDVAIADRPERLPPIETPTWDDRQYRGIRLANGLQALLISDPKSRKSAAAMVVAVGSMNDEKEQPGIANLVRYLLLVACRKYREKHEFKRYLKERGGNLGHEPMTTEAEHKHHFVFEVNHKVLEAALRRFAQYFIEPLFEGVNNTALRGALGNLYKKHDRLMSTDTMRIAQVLKSISEKDHRYNNLSYGTVHMLNEYAGLNREPSDDKLMDFIRKWYSANLMRLVVVGDEKLDVLEEIVTTSFSAIANTGVEKLIIPYEQHPWKSNQLKHKICIVPAKDSTREIRLSFPAPDVLSQYKISPEKYAIQFINHKGPGTLGYILTRRGLCKFKSLRAEYQTFAGIGLFTIVMEPTEEGLKQADSILELTFQYIHLLKNEGVNEWFYEEEKNIDELYFRISEDERMNVLQSLASTMHDVPIEDVIIYKYNMRGPWNAEPVLEFLSNLRPDNVNISVIDKSCKSATNMETEPWYRTEYQIQRISDETINKWGSPTDSFPGLSIPPPNEFIPPTPEEIDTYNLDDNEFMPQHPYIIHSSSISRIWYQREETIPVLQIAFDVISPVMKSNPLGEIFMELLIRILNISFDEYEYSAVRTGHYLDIRVIPVGFQVRLIGPPSTIAVLLGKVRSKISHLENLFSEENFEKSKKETLSYVQDQAKSHKAFQLYLMYRYILISGGWTMANLISLPLQNVIQRQSLERFRTKFFSRIHIQGLIYGDCNDQKAIEIVNTIDEIFKQTSRSMLPQEMLNLFERSVQFKSVPLKGALKLELPEDPSAQIYDLSNHNKKRSVWCRRCCLQGIYEVISGPSLQSGRSGHDIIKRRTDKGTATTYPGKNFVYHAFDNRSKHLYHAFFQFSTVNTSSGNTRLEMTSRLLQKVINESCSKILPPRETGTSECRTDSLKEIDGFGIIITSQMHPRYLDMRTERFLEIVRDRLRDLSEEEFQSHKMNLVTAKLMQMNDRGERFEFYLNEIRRRTYVFRRRAMELDKIENLKKEDLIAFYEEILAKTSPKRRKVALYLYSNALLRNANRRNISADEKDPSKDELRSTIFEDIVTFKNSSVLLPSPISRVNLVP